jgi:hypothetical protein
MKRPCAEKKYSRIIADGLHREKRSHKEWRDLIRAELKGQGGNRQCSATCPICLVSYDVDILSSDASTRALAVGKVASHINSAHADALTDRD